MSSYLKRKFSFLSYKIELLPLGIPDNFFTNTHELPTDCGLQMIFPAQFRYGKNQDVIIKAFAQHIKETGDKISHLTLPGCGELLEQMKSLAFELGIANRVSFPGQCTKEQIRQLYIQNNIGIVASNSETFGQSIVEPFVLGRCILTTPVGIAPDIIQEREGGFFFQTTAQLTQLMETLYNNPPLIVQCGERNFNQKEQFRWTVISQQYQSLFLTS
jgi:glycosyltransferase involved in cell wall biosynthesis